MIYFTRGNLFGIFLHTFELKSRKVVTEPHIPLNRYYGNINLKKKKKIVLTIMTGIHSSECSKKLLDIYFENGLCEKNYDTNL